MAAIEVVAGAPATPRIDSTGRNLMKRARLQRRKAAGIDAWSPSDLARLPQSWFAALARVWNVVLETGSVPPVWAHVRMVGIDKNDGTTDKRGLGIATIVWRLGLSEIMTMHRSCVQDWLNPGIRSGPGRQMDDIIENLFDDLFAAEEEGKDVLGAKIDIAKFFDRCTPARACLILERLGISLDLTTVIMDFYRQLRIWVQVGQVTAREAIAPLRCLLQGCPGSMLLAIAEMHVWATAINMQHPQVDISCFVDDRLFRACGEDARIVVQNAVATTQRYDHDAGWTWNTKGEVWTTSNDRDFVFAPHVSLLVDVATIVGIQVPVDIAKRSVAAGQPFYTASRKLRSIQKAEHQCKRIARGAPGRNFQARRKRRRLVAQLICPKLSWRGEGQWCRILCRSTGWVALPRVV